MDSELQIGLIALGLIAVVGIVAYNKWQERKHRRHAEDAFRSEHRDVLLETPVKERKPNNERVEPRVADEEPQIPEHEEPQFSAPREPHAHLNTGGGRQTTPGVPPVIDTRVDCVIRIEAIEPLEASRLWTAQQEYLENLNKPLQWFAFDDADNVWRPLTPNTAGAYHWYCAAMQMVDRRGAINEKEFRLFSDGVQRVADQFLAVPADVPARSATLSSAAEMDQFCASVDVQVGINIVSNEAPFPGTKIRALAESAGMQLADDGSFHACDEEGNTLFTLCNLETALFSSTEMRNLTTHGITLVIDVPVVGDGVRTFDRMMRLAEHIAHALGASVVDDNRAPLGPEASALIRSQIQHFQARMSAHDIPPGSTLAARLFSA